MCTGSGVYSLQQVARHNQPTDCWVVVHGDVYDVTDYVPRHPGGAMIYVKAGGDCSQLFDSYHITSSARHVLEKYRIGTLEEGSPVVRYEAQGTEDKLHMELKAAAHQYFKQNKLDPRVSTSLYAKALIIVTSILISAFWAFYYENASYKSALVAAAVLGLGMAEVGMSIQHDANHGAFSRTPWLCQLAGLTLDAVGASSFMWKQQHVVGHHVFTNVHNEDPDIRVSSDGSDVRRVAAQNPHGAHHTVQHWYLGLLYGLLAIKSILVDDFAALAKGRIGPVRVNQLAVREQVEFWTGKVVFLIWFVVGPLVWGPWGPAALAGLWLLALAVTGWILAFMFQVAHVVDGVEFLERDERGRIAGGWAAQQVATSADFSHGSWWWLHISGGLNYQVVHHLFPGVAHTHYPALAPIVQRICKQHGVTYKVYPSFLSALKGHFSHLQKMSVKMSIPGLHSIG